MYWSAKAKLTNRLFHKGISIQIINSRRRNCTEIYGYSELLKVFRALFDSCRQRFPPSEVTPTGLGCFVWCDQPFKLHQFLTKYVKSLHCLAALSCCDFKKYQFTILWALQRIQNVSASNSRHLPRKHINHMITNSCCIRLLISHDFQKRKRMLEGMMESYCRECTTWELQNPILGRQNFTKHCKNSSWIT